MYQHLSQAAILLSQTKVMSVGRQAGSYLLIDHDSVSRRHAEISFANQQYILRDLGSSNGTFVNEVRLEADKVYILNPGDRVRFGKMSFTFKEKEETPANNSITRQRGEKLPGKTKLHDLTTGF